MATENGVTLSFQSTGTFEAEKTLATTLSNSSALTGPEHTFADTTALRRTLKALDLYPFAEEDSVIAQAAAGIQRCLAALNAARLLTAAEAYIQQDEQMMRARAAAMKIFEYRRIGEGYGAVTNAIAWSLKNLATDRPTPRQLTAIISTLERLKEEPFLHFDSAIQMIDELEDTSLEVEPQLLDKIVMLEYENE